MTEIGNPLTIFPESNRSSSRSPLPFGRSASDVRGRMPYWAWAVPAAAVALLGLACAAAMIGAVFVAVHHAEVVAHKLGEPFGTLVLAIAVTIIEVALILSMMFAGGPETAALPRDTIFSAVMIICNGVVGICLLLGALRHYEQSFRLESANSGLATLIALSTLSLVLPSFTVSAPGPFYTTAQLAFAGVASLVLWGTFVFVQTGRHRDYFLPTGDMTGEDEHAHPPSAQQA